MLAASRCTRVGGSLLGRGVEMRNLGALFTLVLVVTAACGVCGCDREEWTRGCRISKGRCECGYGCDAEYRYRDRNQCESSLMGRRPDPCESRPCKNGGICVQRSGGYECRCLGTGYAGMNCTVACPENPGMDSRHHSVSLPLECLVTILI